MKTKNPRSPNGGLIFYFAESLKEFFNNVFSFGEKKEIRAVIFYFIAALNFSATLFQLITL